MVQNELPERSNGVTKQAGRIVSLSSNSNRNHGESVRVDKKKNTTSSSASALATGTSKRLPSGSQVDSQSSSSSSSAPQTRQSHINNHSADSNNNNNNNNDNTSSKRLVFGLNARTNKLKHNEYAAERSQRAVKSTNINTQQDQAIKQSVGSSSPKITSTANQHQSTKSGIGEPSSRSSDANREQQGQRKRVVRENSCDDLYPSKELTEKAGEAQTQQNDATRVGREIQRKTTSERIIEAPRVQQVSVQGNSVINTLIDRPGSSEINQSREQQTMVAETKTTDNGAESRRRSPRHKSPSGRKTTKSSENSNNHTATSPKKVGSTNGVVVASDCEKENRQNSGLKPRTQFNIPPPPPMQPSLGFGHRSGATGGSSMVSYAKARIYERPNNNQSSIMRNDIDPTLRTCSTGNVVDSLQLRDSIVPKSISCGFKPPKQVNVSQARAKWEGGEPFAKTKSRQRLAAQASKRLLPGTWSMTSVVATQQMQLQQALAQSSGYSRSTSSSSVDQSVKLLTRGSVLERVQQFEKVPSSPGSATSSSSIPLTPSTSNDTISSVVSSPLSPSSSTDSVVSTISTASSLASTSTTTSSDGSSGDLGAEASITIDKSREQIRTSGSLSPEVRTIGSAATTGDDDSKEQWPTSKRALYKHKVSRLQQEQLRQWRQTGSPLQQQQQQQPATYERRLSLRRRSLIGQQGLSTSSSASSLNNSSSQNIPKFYHPSGLKPNTYILELQKRNIAACFDKFPDRCASLIPDDPVARRQFHSIAVACGYSEYYKMPLQTYVRYCIEQGASNQNDEQRNGLGPDGKPRKVGLQRKQSTIAFNAMTNGTNIGGDQMSQKIHVKSAKTTNVGGPAAKTAFGRATSIDSSTPPMPADRLRRSSIIVDKSNCVDCDQFFTCWRQLIEMAHDLPAQFVRLLTLGQRDYLLPDDFVPMIQSIIDDHPGLKFLRAAPDFHMRYIQTVIARIYYCVNKSWTGRISLSELRRSNLLPVLTILSQEDDINLITDYFSYEHFYVIYCKFWNLDQDHDLLIGKEDLARHNDASISSRIIERIFSGAVSKQIQKTSKMTYTDFVWFLLAEEDKKHPRSIEYWFRLMDIDGDGYISIYEMEYFYYEQMKRLELMNIEALPFIDTACQLLDLVNPKEKNKISLSDLKRNKMASIFFDTFINLEKYLEHESREFVSSRDIIQDGAVVSDWERYASEEYESLVTEESSV